MSWRKKEVLIVDDKKALRDKLRSLLEKSYRVVTSDTLPEAIAQIENNKFDLVITDLSLTHDGDKSGLKVAAAVKNRRRSTGVIMMTGYGQDTDAFTAKKQGVVDEWITKLNSKGEPGIQFIDDVVVAVPRVIREMKKKKWRAKRAVHGFIYLLKKMFGIP